MKFTTKQIINEQLVDTGPVGDVGEPELSGTISGLRWFPVYNRRQRAGSQDTVKFMLQEGQKWSRLINNP